MYVIFFIAWFLYLVPIPLTSFLAGLLSFIGLILAIVVLVKGDSKNGIIGLISAIIVSPILYLLGMFIFGSLVIPSTRSTPQVLKEKVAVEPIIDLNNPRFDITSPIIISIPTDHLATEFKHLAITLTLLVGKIEGEDKDFDLKNALKSEDFMETLKNFEPFIKDRSEKLATSYSYNQLQVETTKNDFAKRLKKELNNILDEYGMKPRLQKVLLTSFIFSD